jgi:hypothetical protein
MFEAGRVLFGFLFTAAACWAAGALLLALLPVGLYRGERRLFAFLAGAALLSLLVFCLAALQLARGRVFLAAGILLIGLALARGAHRAGDDPLPPVPRRWKALLVIVLAVFGAWYLVNAMAPEISPDGSSYHLGLVNLYLNHGGLYPIETCLFANLSQGVEMLFLFAFPFGRHSAAALVHAGFLLLLPLVMLAYARRFGFPEAGVAAAVLVFASPLMGVDGTSAYNDVAAACAAFAAFYLVRIWRQEGQQALLLPAGLAAGFCYAAKYPGALALPWALAVVCWTLRREPARGLRAAAVLAAGALALMAPWLVKNWLWVGNPVSPYFNRLFPNSYVTPLFEQGWAEISRHMGIVTSRWQVPWQAAVRGELSGLLGPVFLLAPLALLGLGRAEVRRLVIAGGVFLLPAAYGVDTRYIIPAASFWALALARTLAGRPRLLAAVAAAHALLSWPAVRDLYCSPWAWRLSEFPLRAALRLEPEDSFLRARSPAYAATRMVEEKVPPGGRVFAYAGLQQAYTSREIVVQWASAFNQALCDILWTPLNAELEPSHRIRFTFTRRPWRALRLVETARSPDVWSISEWRVYGAGRELARQPHWRLRAQPNPWAVGRAFDNSLLTRWTAGDHARAGMFVEVDFGRPELVDSLVLSSTRDQPGVRLRLDGRLETGHWTSLSAGPERIEEEPVSRDALRRGAAAEFKYARVDYLYLENDAWGAEDFRSRAAAWGLELIGEVAGSRLYRFR